LATITDGGGVTATEYRTAFHILGNFTFTPKASEFYIDALAKAEVK